MKSVGEKGFSQLGRGKGNKSVGEKGLSQLERGKGDEVSQRERVKSAGKRERG